MHYEFKEITPEEAASLLSRNTNKNRSINKERVTSYASMMEKGQWNEETAEAIKIAKNGDMIDGQHRLLAIIKYGKPVKMLVVSDVSNEAFEVIDTGKKRTAGDALSILQVENSRNVAAAITRYNSMKKGRFGKVGNLNSELKISNIDIVNTYNERPQFWNNTVRHAQALYGEFNYTVSCSFVSSWFAFLIDIDAEAAEDFMTKLCTGVGLTDIKNPIRLLRQELYNNKVNKNKHNLTQYYMNALMIKAWNYYYTNVNPKRLVYNEKTEEYPTIITNSNTYIADEEFDEEVSHVENKFVANA